MSSDQAAATAPLRQAGPPVLDLPAIVGTEPEVAGQLAREIERQGW